MLRLLVVCLGSAIGGGARYLVSTWVVAPYGTMVVNVVGSFLIAFIMFAGLESATISPTTRLALTTGLMGGFTTYSAFSFDTWGYVRQGVWGSAALYTLVTVVVCFGACALGWVTARALLS